MKETPASVARRRLVERLSPSGKTGALRGLLATTYEFDHEFFEADFLPAVLDLGAWDESSWSSRTEMERLLAESEAISLFCEASRYRGRPRSLRVETRPVAVGAGAVLHGKVLVLVREDSVLLLVGSANLTSSGYRRNREAVTLFEASPLRPAASPLVLSAIEATRTALRPWWSETAEKAAATAEGLLRSWGGAPSPKEQFLWSGGGVPLWTRFIEAWPGGSPIHRVTIVSPFWSEEDDAGPVATFLGALAARGTFAPGAQAHLLCDAAQGADGKPAPALPASMLSLDPSRFGVHAFARAVDPGVATEEVGGESGEQRNRPLHAKVVLVEGAAGTLAYVGSANFTRHGWGFLGGGRGGNLEAGVLLFAGGKDRARLQALLPITTGPQVPLDGSGRGRVAPPPPSEEARPWPAFLEDLALAPSKANRAVLDLAVTLSPEEVTGPWDMRIEEGDAEPLFGADRGCSGEIRVPLTPEALRRLLRRGSLLVRWGQPPCRAEFPLNVSLEARLDLPIAPGSTEPTEVLLLEYYQGRISWEELFPPPPDELAAAAAIPGAKALPSSVDTSSIQSYQVRSFVEALRGLDDDLKAAAQAGPGAMRLALLGPVSPLALARAVRQAASEGRRTAVAAGFELVEVLQALDRARDACPDASRGEVWIPLLEEAVAGVRGLLDTLRADHPGEVGPRSSFARYERIARRAAGKPEGRRA